MAIYEGIALYSLERDEEATCSYCGTPYYHGEDVYLPVVPGTNQPDVWSSESFCGAGCHARWEAHEARKGE